jgi:hypothetical protein
MLTIGNGDLFTVDSEGYVNVDSSFSGTSGIKYQIAARGTQTAASTGSFIGLYTNPEFTGTTGTQNSLVGLYSLPDSLSSGSTTAMYGVLSTPYKTGTGRVVNMYGMFTSVNNNNASGVISNGYGLFIADSLETGVITNDYGLYQADASAHNYFAGNLGIGDTSPDEATLVIGSAGAGNIFLSPDTIGSNSNALCWDNSGASTIYDCTGTPADYAESYPTETDVAFGHIVMTTENTVTTNIGTTVSTLAKAKHGQGYIMGVTSDNYHDFTSAGKEEIVALHHPLPVALIGRVPVKVNLEGGPLEPGDKITLSSVAGVGTKATSTGAHTVGTALEPYTAEDAGNGDDTILVFVENDVYQAEQSRVRQALFGVDLEDNAEVFDLLLTETTDTVWSRLSKLAEGFVDGVLSVTGLQTEELCIGNTCVNEAQLIELLDGQNSPVTSSGGGDVPPPPNDGGDDEDQGGGDTGGDTGTTTSLTPPQDPPPEDSAPDPAP